MNNAAKFGLIGAAAIATGLLLRRLKRFDFAEKTVLITGGSRGLGLAIARRLAREHANLVLLARTEDDLRRAEKMLIGYGGEVLTIPCDVRDQAQVEAAVALAIQHFRQIDVLINNAGVIQVGPLDNMGMHEFETAMAVHFWGPLFTMSEIIPHMRQHGGGRIVNVSSIGGKVAVPHLAPYCASKFALVGLSDALRAELARDHIHVTTVCPWLMRTGSVYNIEVKGKHEREFALFAIAASVPGITVNADRAAKKVIEAARRGAARLVMSPFGKISAVANELTPGVMARIQQAANRLLPKPDLTNGDFPKTGWQSRGDLVPRPITMIARRSALRNNELQHAQRQVREQPALQNFANPSDAPKSVSSRI
jgi:NAD(P)-dependent dehydrogenase (short-subunit alcohol dehydrogenase family)